MLPRAMMDKERKRRCLGRSCKTPDGQLLLEMVSAIEEINPKLNRKKFLWKLTRLVSIVRQSHPYLSDKHKIQLMLRLKIYLSLEDTEVIAKVMTILIELTEDFTSLSQDVVVAIMVQAKDILLKRGDCMELLCEMLSNLVTSHQENQDLLAASSCLDCLLECFTICLKEQNSNCSVMHVFSMVNVLICAACEPTNSINKIQIFSAVAPEVVAYGIKWLKNTESSPEAGYILKDCLFLCRRIITESQECKELCLQENCLQMLLHILREKERIKEHIEINLNHIKRPLLVDFSPTIFASFVLLLTEAVTDCIKAKQIAEELHAVSVLEYYLDIDDNEQLYFVVTCLIHLIDEVSEENKELVSKMEKLAQKHNWNCLELNILVQYFFPARQGRKGTPHPRKRHGVATKRKNVVPSTSTQQSEKVCNNDLALNPLRTLPIEVGNAIPHEFFVTAAELMIFFNCVQTYGNDMVAIRKAFPFHPSMTPGDLYALWRAIWRKKIRRL